MKLSKPLGHRTVRRCALWPLLLCPIVTARIASAEQVVFISMNNPNWSVPANWSTGMLPQAGDDVLIDAFGLNGTFVNLDTDATISTLTLLRNKRLYLKDGFALTLGGATLSNAGAIEFQSAGGLTSLMVPGGNELSVTGGGTIILQSNSRIGGTGRFINLDNRIRGSGVIGQNTIGIENGQDGIIDARAGDVAGITLDPSPSGGMVNRGLLRASSGGILRLSGNGGGSFDNAGGSIHAEDGSQVHLLSGAVIAGGTLSTSGSGTIRLPDRQLATLHDAANTGNLVLNSSAELTLAGNVINSGRILLQRDLSGTRPTQLLVPAGTEATLSGGGTVTFEDGQIRGRLINIDNTIEGTAGIGIFTAGMVNQGTIRSVQPNTGFWILSNAALPMTNSGTIEVSNGGIITLSGQLGRVFNNHGGRIQADPLGGCMIQLDSGATVVGGTMGPGFLRVQNLTSGRIEDLEMRGIFEVIGGLTLAGTISNGGQFMTEGRLNIDGAVTLLGTGYVTTEANGRVGGSGTLINESNQIIGVGHVGDNAIAIENRAGGLIASRTGFASSTLVLDPRPGSALVNSGVLRAGGGTLVLSGNGGGSFDSSAGAIEILNGATLSTTAGAVLLAGPISNAGTLAHQTVADVGPIDGTGTVTAGPGSTLLATRLRQGRLAIGNSGSVTLRASGADASSSRLNALDLAGTPGAWLATLDLNDNALVIDYSGPSPLATVQSQLRSAYAGGTWDGPGITSSPARAAAGTAQPTAVGFAEATDLFVQFPAIFRGQSIDATSLLLDYVLSGDADLDGQVDLDDFNALAQHYGQSQRRWSQGDFNYDGLVNLADFDLLAGNFGLSASGPQVTAQDWAALAAAVPEPAVAWLLVSALAGMMRHRRRPAAVGE